MKKILTETLEAVTTDGRNITLDISDEACLYFGFVHGDILMNPGKNKVKIMGVAKGNEREDVLWYTIIHPAIKNEKVCYWSGLKNLVEAGFKFLDKID